ncbi:hypothetical protein [Streptomyces sp. NPDC001340]
MRTRGRALKFTAVLTFVVLSLTGFSTGRHHSRHSGGGGGGGCSSSHQDHDSSSSSTSGGGSYDDSDGDSYGSSGTSTSGSTSRGSYHRRPTHRSTPTPSSTGSGDEELANGTAKLLSCTTEKKPYATVEVTNPNARSSMFWVLVYFKDEGSVEVARAFGDGKVPAKSRKTVKVLIDPSLVAKIDHCQADPVATAYPG